MRAVVALIVYLGVLFLVPGTTLAQNNSFAAAQNIVPGQPPLQFALTLNFPGEFSYFVFRAVNGRSYCTEVVGGPAETTRIALAGVFVFRADQSTEVAASNGLTPQEPLSGNNGLTGVEGLARTCWIAPASERAYIRAHKGLNATAGIITYQMRVVETTLFSNWFFLGGDYGAFTLLRNTTSSALSYTVNWRDAAGALAATSSGTLAGNGSAFVNARDFSGARTAVSGTVEIAHDSSPDALAASTTVLSGTTGLSFDAPFMKRHGGW